MFICECENLVSFCKYYYCYACSHMWAHMRMHDTECVCRSEENFHGVIFLPSLLHGFQGLNLGHQMSAVRTFTWESLPRPALVMPDSGGDAWYTGQGKDTASSPWNSHRRQDRETVIRNPPVWDLPTEHSAFPRRLPRRTSQPLARFLCSHGVRSCPYLSTLSIGKKQFLEIKSHVAQVRLKLTV